MPEENYIVGEAVRLNFRIVDAETKQLVDPGTILLKVKPGSGTVVNLKFGEAPEIIRDNEGLYHTTIQLTTDGLWIYRLEFTSPNAGASQGTISVRPSLIDE